MTLLYMISPVRGKVLLLTMLIVLLQGSLRAQQPQPTISIELKEASLEELIRKVESLTDYSFIYGEEIGRAHV